MNADLDPAVEPSLRQLGVAADDFTAAWRRRVSDIPDLTTGFGDRPFGRQSAARYDAIAKPLTAKVNTIGPGHRALADAAIAAIATYRLGDLSAAQSFGKPR